MSKAQTPIGSSPNPKTTPNEPNPIPKNLNNRTLAAATPNPKVV